MLCGKASNKQDNAALQTFFLFFFFANSMRVLLDRIILRYAVVCAFFFFFCLNKLQKNRDTLGFEKKLLFVPQSTFQNGINDQKIIICSSYSVVLSEKMRLISSVLPLLSKKFEELDQAIRQS